MNITIDNQEYEIEIDIKRAVELGIAKLIYKPKAGDIIGNKEYSVVLINTADSPKKFVLGGFKHDSYSLFNYEPKSEQEILEFMKKHNLKFTGKNINVKI